MVLHSTLNLNIFFYLGSFSFPCEENLEDFALHSFDKWTLVSWIIDGNSIPLNTFISIFCKYQRLFFAILRLQRQFKCRKYLRYDAIDMDLNTIENVHDSNIIQLIEDDTIYSFRDRDIFRICYNALTNGYFLFPCPKVPKNPWTNKEFSKHNVYNILFFLKSRNKINMLLCSYLECDLDLNLFSCKQFHELQKILTYQRVDRMELADILEIFLEMFSKFIKDYEILYSTFNPEFVTKHQRNLRFIVKLYYIFLYTSSESTLYEYNKKRFFTECYIFILNYDDKFVKIPNTLMDISGNNPFQIQSTRPTRYEVV